LNKANLQREQLVMETKIENRDIQNSKREVQILAGMLAFIFFPHNEYSRGSTGTVDSNVTMNYCRQPKREATGKGSLSQAHVSMFGNN